MGGIPGTSKGCNTCRRRKKACDQKRPSCGQCVKLGLNCEGYQRQTVWVNCTTDNPAALEAVQSAITTKILTRRRGIPEVTLKDGFARSAYQEQYMGLFWDWYLPNGRTFPPETDAYMDSTWLNDIHGMCAQRDASALRQIMLALSLTTLGLRDDKPWMVENGVRHYGGGLATLAAQIESQRGHVEDNALVSTKLLSLYEMLHGHSIGDRIAQAKKWNMHVDGSLSMLKSRGPEYYATGFAHQLFVDGRATQISVSMINRTRSFLSEPEWLEIPFTHHPKKPKDRINDLFTEIPTLLAETDELIAAKGTEAFESQRRELLTHCHALQQEWEIWHMQYAPKVSPIAPETMPTPQVFDHLVAAHCMVNFWACGLVIYAHMELVGGPQDPDGLAGRVGAKWCCSKICEILPTFMHPWTGHHAINGPIFATIVVLNYLEQLRYGYDCPEAQAIFDMYTMGEKGKTTQRFVETICAQMDATGTQTFRAVFDEE